MAFVSSPSSTNEVNTANVQVSTSNSLVSNANSPDSTANLSDVTIYMFLANQQKGSQLVHEDLEQIYEDNLEEMDLKWQLALLSIRARRYFQITGKKITINGSDTAGYDKSKVECFNCHKMGYFARECRGPRNQDNRNTNQDSSRRTVNVEETSSKAMVAIDGADTTFKDSKINALQSEIEKLKKEKESNQIKIDKFENASKSLDKLIGSQISDNSRKDVGYVGLEEFQQPEFEGYGPKASKSVCKDTFNEVKKTPDAPLGEKLVSKKEKQTVFQGADCNYHQRERVVSGNNYTRVNYNYSAKKAHPNAHRNIVPTTVLMKTGLRPLNTVRPVNTTHPKTTVYSARPMLRFSKSAQSTVKRPYQIRTSLTNKNFSQKVNTAKGKFYTARPNSAVVNDVRANQVGDETIHKELGDRIERAATTASSLKAEQDSANVSTATIDGRVKTVTEASIRRHLKLENSDGISTLPNNEIFDQLALMGNMKRASKGYTGVDTPLFQIMFVQGQTLQGEGSTISVESHHTPTSAPSTSQPPTSSPSMPTTHVAEEAATMPYDLPLPRIHSLGSDEGSLTLNELTVLCTSLSKKVESLESDLKQTKQTYGAAYTKLIMKVKKLEHKVKSIKARRKVRLVISDDEDDLEDPSKQGRKIAQIDEDEGITLVQMGAQTQGRSDEDLMYETGVYDYPEGFTGPSISITTAEPVTTTGEGVSTARAIPKEVSTAELDMDVTLAEALVDLLKSGKKKSPKPKARGISFQDPKEVARREVISPPVSKISAKDKGKAIMTKPEKPLKKKDQIQSDEELALRLHAEEQAQFERLQKERVVQEEASRAAIYEEMDNIQAMIKADEQLAARVQVEEQELYSIKEKSRLLVEMIAERKRFFAAQRAAEQRSKPPTKTQMRNKMCTYLKNMGGYKHNQLKGKSYEEIQKLFNKTYKQVHSFVPMASDDKEKGSKKKVGGSRTKTLAKKRVGEKQSKESSKRQKMEDDAEKEELRAHLDIIPEDDVAHRESNTLQQLRGYSFDEIKVLFEATMKRVNTFTPMKSDDTVPKVVAGSSKRSAEEELGEESSKRQKIGEGSEPVEESIDKESDELSQEQLQQLIIIVLEEGMNVEALQTKYPIIDWEVYTEDSRKYWKIIRVGDHTKSFMGECRRLFEPDTDDLLELQRYMHDPLTWRLYDTCGVHHVSIETRLDIFMLVEKDYPMTRGLPMLMLVNKLQVDQHSEMAYELLRKIFILANRPRH
ncbi:ribonuclease H-like domain-containing protein [Tanacetum coccineum]